MENVIKIFINILVINSWAKSSKVQHSVLFAEKFFGKIRIVLPNEYPILNSFKGVLLTKDFNVNFVIVLYIKIVTIVVFIHVLELNIRM